MIFNAKEKLLQHIKNTNVGADQSNNWNLLIDTKSFEAQEEEEIKEVRLDGIIFPDLPNCKRKRNKHPQN